MSLIQGRNPATGSPVDVQVDGDGKIAVGNAGNIGGIFRESFESYEPNTGGRWVESKASGDLAYVDGNAVAASYLIVSKDPLAPGSETIIELDPSLHFHMPTEIAFGAHMSQRTLGQEFAIEAVDNGVPLPDVLDLEIVSITQTTTTLTVTTLLSHGLSVGKSLGIRAVTDSRLNYPAIVVASVPAPNQFTCTAGPGGSLPSLSAYTSSVLAATTAALPTATYANGTLGVGATLTATANGAFPDQDGVAIPLGGRLLVKNEVAGANNGVYTLTTVGSAGAAWVLTRATDFDVTAEMTVVANALFAVSVYVTSGTTQAQREYYLAATVTTVGTTAVTFTDTGTVGPLGYVYFRERLGRAQNGVSQIFENGTATNASLYIRSESGDALPSGTVAGSHAATIGTTASTQLINSPYTYAFAPGTEFRLLLQSDRVQWADSPVDSTAQMTSRLVRTQVAPNPDVPYKLRLRATNNKSLTAPNFQVVSWTKAGASTTATVVTDRPHGYIVGELVVGYGARDQAASSFPNLLTATPVLSVVDATTFTITCGTAPAGLTVSYGGYFARVNGGNLMSSLGAQAVVAQSAVLSTLVDGTRQLVITGNASWGVGLLIGDMAEVVGLRDAATGASLGCDGPWKVANNSAAALTLVLPSAGQRTLPTDFGSVNCGGALIKRTCLRWSFVRVFDYERMRVEALARPSGDAASGFPVNIQSGSVGISGTPAVTVSSGTITTLSALTGGGVAEDAAAGNNPVIVGGVARTAATPTTIIAGDAVRDTHALSGAKVTRPYAVPETSWNYTGVLTTATAVAAQAAAGVGLKRFPVAVQAGNAGAAAVDLIILDGATERWRIPLPVGTPFDTTFPVELVVTANTALNVNLSAANTGVRVNLQGYTAP